MALIPEDVCAEMGNLARKGQNLAHWEGFKRWVEAEQPDYAH